MVCSFTNKLDIRKNKELLTLLEVSGAKMGHSIAQPQPKKDCNGF